jgi:hypothetical protein
MAAARLDFQEIKPCLGCKHTVDGLWQAELKLRACYK